MKQDNKNKNTTLWDMISYEANSDIGTVDTRNRELRIEYPIERITHGIYSSIMMCVYSPRKGNSKYHK